MAKRAPSRWKPSPRAFGEGAERRGLVRRVDAAIFGRVGDRESVRLHLVDVVADRGEQALDLGRASASRPRPRRAAIWRRGCRIRARRIRRSGYARRGGRRCCRAAGRARPARGCSPPCRWPPRAPRPRSRTGPRRRRSAAGSRRRRHRRYRAGWPRAIAASTSGHAAAALSEKKRMPRSSRGRSSKANIKISLYVASEAGNRRRIRGSKGSRAPVTMQEESAHAVYHNLVRRINEMGLRRAGRTTWA